GMLRPRRPELGAPRIEPRDDRVIVVDEHHLDEGYGRVGGGASQYLSKLAPAEELRHDDIAAATEMVGDEREREIAGHRLGRVRRLPLPEMATQLVDVEYERQRVVTGVALGERRLPHSRSAVDDQQHTCERRASARRRSDSGPPD